MAQKFLTEDEQKKITATVHEMELKTSGEIVVMVGSRSHSYPTAAITGTVLFALPLALIANMFLGPAIWIGSQNIWFFLALFSIFYITIHPFANRSDTLKRFFLDPQQVEEEVREGAITSFFTEQLYKTEEENGTLLYISVMEKKAWILGDYRINEIIDQSTWDIIISDLTRGIKEGKRCGAICDAVRKIGNILSSHFPIKENDKDELHNIIIR
jgi:putative membrane protein